MKCILKKSVLLVIPEINADHPEVQAMVEEAMNNASVPEAVSPQVYAEVLEGAIAEVRIQILCSKVLFS